MISKRAIIYLLGYSVLLGLQSCERKNQFSREVELKVYLKEHLLNFNDKNIIVFLLQNGNCGTCSENTLSLVRSIVDYYPHKSYVIVLREKDEKIAEKFEQKNIVLVQSEAQIIEKKGLGFSSDAVFVVDKEEIVYWSFMDQDFKLAALQDCL
jgi:hypothetical protein